MKFIPTKWLIPTHNLLRKKEIIPHLLDVNSPIHQSAFYHPDEPVQIIRIRGTSDLFINNGHHRLVAAHQLWGCFSMDNIQWKEYAWEEFLEINFDVGWLTPHDPYTECRFPDFWKFKSEMLQTIDSMKKANFFNENKMKRIISTSFDRYAEIRVVNNLEELYVNSFKDN